MVTIQLDTNNKELVEKIVNLAKSFKIDVNVIEEDNNLSKLDRLVKYSLMQKKDPERKKRAKELIEALEKAREGIKNKNIDFEELRKDYLFEKYKNFF